MRPGRSGNATKSLREPVPNRCPSTPASGDPSASAMAKVPARKPCQQKEGKPGIAGRTGVRNRPCLLYVTARACATCRELSINKTRVSVRGSYRPCFRSRPGLHLSFCIMPVRLLQGHEQGRLTGRVEDSSLYSPGYNVQLRAAANEEAPVVMPHLTRSDSLHSAKPDLAMNSIHY